MQYFCLVFGLSLCLVARFFFFCISSTNFCSQMQKMFEQTHVHGATQAQNSKIAFRFFVGFVRRKQKLFMSHKRWSGLKQARILPDISIVLISSQKLQVEQQQKKYTQTTGTDENIRLLLPSRFDETVSSVVSLLLCIHTCQCFCLSFVFLLRFQMPHSIVFISP